MYEPREYTALRDIRYNGALASTAGDAVTSSQIQTLGLTIGVDVRAERPDLVARPGADGTRDEWVNYAMHHGGNPADLDNLSRDDIAHRYADADNPPPVTAKKAEWVRYALARDPALSAEAADTMTRDDLTAAYGPDGTWTDTGATIVDPRALPDPNGPGQPRQK